MGDRELIAAMHCLGEDLTAMAEELADRRGALEGATAMLAARDALAKEYAKIMCQEADR